MRDAISKNRDRWGVIIIDRRGKGSLVQCKEGMGGGVTEERRESLTLYKKRWRKGEMRGHGGGERTGIMGVCLPLTFIGGYSYNRQCK